MDDHEKADKAKESQAAILAAGAAVAEKMALRLQKAYEKSVAEYWASYAAEGQMPDEDDFFAWLEGYGWEEVE